MASQNGRMSGKGRKRLSFRTEGTSGAIRSVSQSADQSRSREADGPGLAFFLVLLCGVICSLVDYADNKGSLSVAEQDVSLQEG